MVRENTPNSPPRSRHRRNGSCFFLFIIGGLLGALAVAVAWMMDERGDAPGPVTVGAPRAPQTQPKPRYQYPTILPGLEVVVPDEETSDRPPALPPPPPSPEELKALAKAAASKEPAKGGAKESAKPLAKESGKEPAKPPAKEAGKEPAKAPVKETAKTPAKEPVKESTKIATATKPPETPPAKPVAPPPKPAESVPTEGDNETYILQVASLGSPEEAERFKAKLAQQGIAVNIQQASVDGKTHYRVRTSPLKGKDAASKAKSQLASKGFAPMMIKLK
ncbi:MAG: SPOR domain-containing protein [Chromatiaceae bacterium]